MKFIVVILLFATIQACQKSAKTPGPTTEVVGDLSWEPNTGSRAETEKQALQEFLDQKIIEARSDMRSHPDSAELVVVHDFLQTRRAKLKGK